MTPEAQRIEIAKACGWKHIRLLGDPLNNRWVCFTDDQNGYPPEAFKEDTLVGLHPMNCEGARLCELPDYLTDLNAMHEAEKVLDNRNTRGEYVTRLETVCKDSERKWPLFRTTAAQRAEAFLRTIGKWDDTK